MNIGEVLAPLIIVGLGLTLCVWLLTLVWSIIMIVIDGVSFRRRAGNSRGLTSDFNRIKGRMTRMRRETLLLVPAKEPGFSKVGGLPDLPLAWEWPHGERQPRAFVAQVDLGAFRTHGGPDWLPSEGRLYFFYDPDRESYADVVTVHHTQEAPGSEASYPPTLPSRCRFGERRVAFMTFPSIPSLDWLNVELEKTNISDDELDALANAPAEIYGDEIQHRIGGYPCEIQDGQMALECEWMRRGLERDYSQPPAPALIRAARQWRLLLQVDSDPPLGMNWSDTGRLYVFVREKDARAGNFTRTVALSQSH